MADAWPRTETCGGCGETVLRARHARQGHPFKLDPIPVLPEGPCGTCKGRGRKAFDAAVTSGGRVRGVEPGDQYGRTNLKHDTCPACHGSGRLGEPLTADHVLLGVDGIARRFDGDRATWEAAHRRHRCRPTHDFPDALDRVTTQAA